MLYFVFGTVEDAESARRLCEQELGNTWDTKLGHAVLPYNDRTTDGSNLRPGQQISLYLAFRDRLQDVQNAMVPLGAVSVRLGMLNFLP